MSDTPIKSAHALLLNRLTEMQRVPLYCKDIDELAFAVTTILELEAENARLNIELERLTKEAA